MKPLQIIVFEDEVAAVERIRTELAGVGISAHLRHVASSAAFEAALASPGPDLVLANFVLRDGGGLFALALARSLRPGLPFIFTADAPDDEQMIEALRCGATDFVRGGRLVRLGPSILRAMREVEESERRQRAEQALRESEGRFRQMAACIEDVLYAVDGITGEFQYVSPAFERMLGYTLDDVEAMGGRVHFLELTIEAGMASRQKHTFDMLQRGEAATQRQWQSWWKCKDGTSKYLEDRWIPVYDGGRLRTTYGVLRDITTRHRAETAQRESEEQLRAIGDHLPGGALYQLLQPLDGRNGFSYISAGIEKLFGFSADSILADPAPFWSCIVEEDRPRIDAEQAACARDLTLFDCEFRQRHASGQVLWLHARSKPRRLADGTVVWDGVVLDITRRKQAEEQSARLAAIVEQAAETIVITDLQGNIQYVNSAFERVTGYTRAEALGRNPRILKSENQDETFYRAMWAKLELGEVWTGHFVNRRKDGSLYEEDATIFPIRDPAGKVVGYAAIKRDVTEHVRLQEETRRLEAKFLQAQKMETIGRLAGGVAHDFNNLLQAQLGYAEILLSSMPSDDKRYADLLEIQRIGRRAAELTKQLLALGRKQNLDRRVTDANQLVEDMSRMLQRVLGADIRISFQFSPDLPRVMVDTSQIGQIVLNLAVNARDAMPRGGHLSFRTFARFFSSADLAAQSDLRPGSYVCIEVTDSGNGISPETMARLFEPFFTTKEPGKGTGLGLATSYGIARQHDGWLTAESEPGHGARFTLCLPAMQRRLDDDGERVSPPMPALETLQGRGERILLVEDEEVIRVMLKSQLERSGYVVSAAPDAAGAIEEFLRSENNFDLVLTDVVLPDLNGLELLDKLIARKPGLRVLVCSGYTDNERRWPIILERKWRFLAKPYAFAELLTQLHAVLAGD